MTVKLSKDSLNAVLDSLGISVFKTVKEDAIHAVLETPDHFIKICVIDECDHSSRFREVVNDAYAQEYRKLGIDWEHFIIKVGSAHFSIERREKLRMLDETEMSIEEAIKKFSLITRRVERKLGFAGIFSQIMQNENFHDIRKLALINSREIDISDYVTDPSGYVVNLKTSGWFLALIGKEGTWATKKTATFMPVKCMSHDFVFMPNGVNVECERTSIKNSISEVSQDWWLADIDVETIKNYWIKTEADVESYYSHNVSTLMKENPTKICVQDSFGNLLKTSESRSKNSVIDVEMLRDDLSVAEAVNAICLVENKKEISTTVSQVIWKRYFNQVVVESDDYFYKIYEEELTGPGKFYSQIRRCLAKAYNNLGIYWKVITFERGGSLFDFEQREKLRVATEDDSTLDDVLSSFSSVLKEVEEMLEFDSIVSQLKEACGAVFNDLKELKLGRYCRNKFDDFAIFENIAILLDDADFYVALVNSEGEHYDVPPEVEVPIKTSYGDFLFTKKICHSNDGFSEKRTVPKHDVSIHGWYLYSFSATADETRSKQHNSKTKTKGIVKRESSGILSKEVKNRIDSVEFIAGMKDEVEQESKSYRIDETDAEIIEVDCQADDKLSLFEFLDKFEDEFEKSRLKGEMFRHSLVVCTNFDGVSQTFEEAQFSLWANAMTAISAYYPHVKKLTKIALTEHFCNKVLQGEFCVEKFQQRFRTDIRFFFPVDQLTFPKRRLFREVALRFAKSSPEFLNRFFCHEEDVRDCKCYSDSEASMVEDFKQIIHSWRP